MPVEITDGTCLFVHTHLQTVGSEHECPFLLLQFHLDQMIQGLGKHDGRLVVHEIAVLRQPHTHDVGLGKLYTQHTLLKRAFQSGGVSGACRQRQEHSATKNDRDGFHFSSIDLVIYSIYGDKDTNFLRSDKELSFFFVYRHKK